MKKTIFLSIALLLAVSAAAECRTIMVKADSSGEYPTIQAAIDDCNDGDIILLADGTYTGDGNRDIDFLGKAITVKSENGPEDCVIDCNGTASEPHRGFHFHSGEDANSVIAGLTITNGYAPLMPEHRTPVGGAIYCISSSPTIHECAIRGNLAGVGGGIYCGKSESVISKCEISGNSARYGGGIRLYDCQAEINNCLITNNTAWERNGGGMIVSFGTAAITNCTISNNVADRRISGGMYCDEATVTITNCIFWDNSPSEISEGPSGNATATYCDIKGGWPGEGNIEADPCFADANNGDYYLLADSPCIDAGDPHYVPGPNETDLDGNPRLLDGDGDGISIVDMGAYEYNPPIEAEMRFTPQALNCEGKGKWVKVHIVLPEGILVEDVDVNEPAVAELMDMKIESEYIKLLGSDKGSVRLEVVFGREEFCSNLPDVNDDTLDVTVCGYLMSGQRFCGTDRIRIIRRR